MARSLYYLIIILFSVSLVSCSRRPTHQASGYVEGRYTYIATPVSGVLKEIFVARGNSVKQGQKLFILEAQPESDAYNAAQQNLQEATNARNSIAANLQYAKLTYERYKVLVPKGAIQQSQLDNARSIYNATLAQLAQANSTIESYTAKMKEAGWRQDQKIGYAPKDALVFDTYYRLGEYTEAHRPIISLLVPADIKVIFYVIEKDVGAIQLNDEIEVYCDGCKNPTTGKISFISPTAEYTPPVIFSEQTNAELVFRVEGDFYSNPAALFHPGQPVIVKYHPHV